MDKKQNDNTHVDMQKTDIKLDSTQNFTGRANAYTAGRPTYAAAFIEKLYLGKGFSEQTIIADIGSGTGKFAKQLLDRGSFVYCVEPNDDMRRVAIKELQGYEKFRAVNGTATATTLEKKSIDVITTAQAFHWFDAMAFQAECRRILKPGGLVFLIWNMRDMSDEVQQRNFKIYIKYCPNFKGFAGGIQKDDIRIKRFFDGKYAYEEFDHPLFYDRDTFIHRSLSGSYSLKEGDEGYEAYMNELLELFEKYADGGVLTMRNKTVAYWGKLD